VDHRIDTVNLPIKIVGNAWTSMRLVQALVQGLTVFDADKSIQFPTASFTTSTDQCQKMESLRSTLFVGFFLVVVTFIYAAVSI
jgi:hypothetical protein